MESKSHEAEARAAGAHKLAEEFSVNLLIDGELEPNGRMDFKSMNAVGVLRNGSHVHGNIIEPIEAQATKITLPDGSQTFAIVVQTKDHSATYKGVLMRDQANQLTVVGVFEFDTAQRKALGNLFAQNEGVWVITKP